MNQLTNLTSQGNTTFTNFLNSTAIGQAFIDNLVLVPGDNNVSIRANVSQLPILEAVMSEPFCNTGVLPLSFIGQNVTNNGQELTYFEQAFRANNLTTNVNVGADLDQIGFNISCNASTTA